MICTRFWSQSSGLWVSSRHCLVWYCSSSSLIFRVRVGDWARLSRCERRVSGRGCNRPLFWGGRLGRESADRQLLSSCIQMCQYLVCILSQIPRMGTYTDCSSNVFAWWEVRSAALISSRCIVSFHAVSCALSLSCVVASSTSCCTSDRGTADPILLVPSPSPVVTQGLSNLSLSTSSRGTPNSKKYSRSTARPNKQRTQLPIPMLQMSSQSRCRRLRMLWLQRLQQAQLAG